MWLLKYATTLAGLATHLPIAAEATVLTHGLRSPAAGWEVTRRVGHLLDLRSGLPWICVGLVEQAALAGRVIDLSVAAERATQENLANLVLAPTAQLIIAPALIAVAMPTAAVAATPGGRDWLLNLAADHSDLAQHAVSWFSAGALADVELGLAGLGLDPGLALASDGSTIRFAQGLALVGEAAGDRASKLQVGTVTTQGSAGRLDLPTLVAGVDDCYPEPGRDEGVVRVQRLTGPDGARSWVVQIPGTQNWTYGRPGNPFDLRGDILALAGRRPPGGDLVLAALAEAGARPGEPVLLVGHSQGGIIATQLASDPAVLSRYNITHVVTAGAPVGNSRPPSVVRILALESSDDLTPSLDGVPNPSAPNWITVLGPGEEGRDLGTAHGAANYARLAGRFAADGSGGSWLNGAQAFFGPEVRVDGSVTVRGTQVYG
jgi:hypothetical protein